MSPDTQAENNTDTAPAVSEKPSVVPFDCGWEVGIRELDDPTKWDHFHPMAKTEAEAKRKAKQMARKGNSSTSDAFDDPVVYSVHGPYKPEDPARVGREMIEKVFESNNS